MFFFFQAEDGIRDGHVTGVQTCALPISGTAKSYLVATESMKVYIKALDKEIDFEAWESIHTEISQKYDDAAVAWLAKIGRASCRERVEISVVEVVLNSRKMECDAG